MSIIIRLTVGSTTVVNRGLDHTWEIMRRLGKDGAAFSITELRAATNDSSGTISEFLRRLHLAGIARPAGEQLGTRGKKHKLWKLVKAPSLRPAIDRAGQPCKGVKARQQMWNFVRGPMARDGFTLADIVAYAATADIAVTPPMAKRLVTALADAAYLVDVGGRPKRWRLKPSMNTGPLPPAVLESKVVFDRNRNVVFGSVTAQETAP